MGDEDKAIGNAIRFIRFAQQKFKKGRLVTEQEFKSKGFSEALFGVFAERSDGHIKAIGSEKHFSWLRDRVLAGSKGGRVEKTRNEENQLLNPQANGSKPKQTQASPSPSFSPSCSRSNNLTTLVQQELHDAARLHEIAELWNQNCGVLSPVKKMNTKRLQRCKVLWKRNSNPEIWRNQIKEFVGHSHNVGNNDRGWIADFDFFLREDIQTRIVEGYYSPRISKSQEQRIMDLLKQRGEKTS